MITWRRAEDRGRTRFDWLDGRHTFSFGEYHDPAWMGFRDLRVINDDRVAPGGGFGTHPHRDMEILTYVLGGALEHRDSLGTGSLIRPGEVQVMSAGTGITHSEFNPSQKEATRLLQIWILPEKRGLPPRYDQEAFPDEERRARLRIVASQDGRDGSLVMKQDVRVYTSLLAPGEEVNHRLETGRHAWVQVARGELNLNGDRMSEGDGAAISGESFLTLRGLGDSELLLFDLR